MTLRRLSCSEGQMSTSLSTLFPGQLWVYMGRTGGLFGLVHLKDYLLIGVKFRQRGGPHKLLS